MSENNDQIAAPGTGGDVPGLESLAVFNKPGALATLEGDEDFLLELLEVFKEISPEHLDNLAAAMAAADWNVAERLAHTLKSMTLNLGAERFRTVAGKMEKAVAAKDFDLFKRLHPLLLEEYRSYLGAIGG